MIFPAINHELCGGIPQPSMFDQPYVAHEENLGQTYFLAGMKHPKRNGNITWNNGDLQRVTHKKRWLQWFVCIYIVIYRYYVYIIYVYIYTQTTVPSVLFLLNSIKELFWGLPQPTNLVVSHAAGQLGESCSSVLRQNVICTICKLVIYSIL